MDFPEGLEKIGLFAFCKTGVVDVVLHASLRTIAQGAFAMCDNLKTVVLSEGLSVLGTNEYPGGDNCYCGVFEQSALECVTLPSTLKRIEYSTFRRCEHLKGIRLPEQLEYIGKQCFEESGLVEI